MTNSQICVLETSVGISLVIRSNPSVEEIKGFVIEHTARLTSGRAAGPSGDPAYQIYNATLYKTEAAWLTGTKGKVVDISNEILPTT